MTEGWTVTTTDQTARELEAIAGRALSACRRLELCMEWQPARREPARWSRWRTASYLPAHRSWVRAMDDLEALLGDRFPGRAGDGWARVCVQILSGELRR